MSHDYLNFIEPELEEFLSMGFSIKAASKKFNISEDILVKTLQSKRQERSEFQKTVDEKYSNGILEY